MDRESTETRPERGVYAASASELKSGSACISAVKRRERRAPCRNSTIALIGSLILAAAASAQEISQPEPDNTNRVSLSLRVGFNISGKFKGIGNSFRTGPLLSGGRLTPNGDPYNYDNGYVLTDSSGNYGGQSWYWGYDNAAQVNSGANTISFTRTAASNVPSENSGDDSPYVGAELACDIQVATLEFKHPLRYGFEGALNFMPIEFNSGGLFNNPLSQRTDTYAYTPGTTPPSVPPAYQGSFGGPGFVINVPTVGSTVTPLPGGTLLARQHFDADLWGARLGPYVEMPFVGKLDAALSAGLAVGLLDANASWKETLTLPAGGGSMNASGSGHDTSVLFGFFVGLNAIYPLSDRWCVQGGFQYQNLGTYHHDFGGRTAELDLKNSLFLQAGIGFKF